MKLKFLLISCLLAGCAPYATVHQEKNKTTFHLNADYQVAYRVISQNMVNCETPDSIQSVIFIDQKKATVTMSIRDVTGFTVDLSDDGQGGTNADFYTIFSAQKNYRLPLIMAWVNEGKSGCDPKKLK